MVEKIIQDHPLILRLCFRPYLRFTTINIGNDMLNVIYSAYFQNYAYGVLMHVFDVSEYCKHGEVSTDCYDGRTFV